MQYTSLTCERCGSPRGDGAFCENCRVLNADLAAGLYAAPGAPRLMARFLDLLLFGATAGIGWWIWLGSTAGEGQSPAKRMLGLRVVGRDGTPLSAGAVWFREGVLGLLLLPLLPISALLAIGTSTRQSLTGLLSGSVVVRAEARPIAAHERRREPGRAGGATGRDRLLPPPPVTRPALSSTPTTRSERGGSSRSPGPSRSQAPESSGSTTHCSGSRGHQTSEAPARSGSTERSPQAPDAGHPAPSELNWPGSGTTPSDEPPHQDLSNDKPMWPAGVPPWQRSGERTPGSPPSPPRAPARPPGTPPADLPPAPPRQPGSAGVSYSPRAHTAMEKITELETMYRSGQVDRKTFENERRRLIAES